MKKQLVLQLIIVGFLFILCNCKNKPDPTKETGSGTTPGTVETIQAQHPVILSFYEITDPNNLINNVEIKIHRENNDTIYLSNNDSVSIPSNLIKYFSVSKKGYNNIIYKVEEGLNLIYKLKIYLEPDGQDMSDLNKISGNATNNSGKAFKKSIFETYSGRSRTTVADNNGYFYFDLDGYNRSESRIQFGSKPNYRVGLYLRDIKDEAKIDVVLDDDVELKDE